MPASERSRELKRRRHRKKKLQKIKNKCEKATASEKVHLAGKIRRLTPGAEVLIESWGLEANS